MNSGVTNSLNSKTYTLIGFGAVLMWSATIGLFRSVSEFFGPTGGAALIFTTSGILASLFFGLRVRDIPRTYLLGGGLLFVTYEIFLALSIGLAHSRAQSLELGMINYLWPSLTILFAVIARQQKSSWLLLPAILLCVVGITFVMKGDGNWSIELFLKNIKSNPLAYSLAFGAAFIWAMYSLVARKYGDGKNAVPLFLVVTAVILWGKYIASAESSITFNVTGMLQVVLLGSLTAAAYTCWNYGVQKGSLTLLAIASYFTPILSMLLGCLWLGVQPNAGFLYGVGMVTIGSLISWWATR
ncbi:MAG: EamA family transporter [Cellvibrio sp. 79]|nr:MAG: EamA family transporter [Cellvibrio sp. 79]